MKTALTALAALGLVAASVVAAAPAQAYDTEAYEYAAGHMLQSRDLPKGLGDFGTGMMFNAYSGGKLYICYVDSKDITAPKSRYTFGANFFEDVKDKAGNSISQAVYQYPSAQKAIAAYQALAKAIKGCTGTTTSSWTDDESGTTQTSSSLTTNGKVPMVTEVGVESLFVNTNYLTTSTDASDKYSSDSYTVFSLVNDVILGTSYSTGDLENISTAQRKKVNQLAFTAISRWLG